MLTPCWMMYLLTKNNFQKGALLMSNFSYLSTRPEYSLFANSAIEAEKVFSTSPAMCAVGCRKALELAVKWVYAAYNDCTGST